MNFDKDDLRQFTPGYLKTLPPERVVFLFDQLKEDLFRLIDRLNQNSTNSSRPPSSQSPWERASSSSSSSRAENQEEASSNSTSEGAGEESSNEESQEQQTTNCQKRKPGRQPGSQGFGRTQKFMGVLEELHKPDSCKGCGSVFASDAPFKKTRGYETLDLDPPQPGRIGITGTCTKHIFGKISCTCGHETSSIPHQADPENGWSSGLGEWRLIGPRLLALIVFAKIQLHLTIGKTRILLRDLFGMRLSEGVISNALMEAGQAVSDLEPSILEALRSAGLIYIDESSWMERKVLRWIWVAKSEAAVYFAIGGRTVEMARSILGNFSNWVMSDGYGAYRGFTKRLRCWAHLERKAKGLSESSDGIIAEFGKKALVRFRSLRESIYRMREQAHETLEQEKDKAEEAQAQLCYEMLRHENSEKAPIASFAREITNDPQAIFAVVENPHLPLTNNAAERALRPMVIMRKISYGTKTQEGSRAVMHLASVYETLRLRAADVWQFLQESFRRRRQGSPSPPMPQPS